MRFLRGCLFLALLLAAIQSPTLRAMAIDAVHTVGRSIGLHASRTPAQTRPQTTAVSRRAHMKG